MKSTQLSNLLMRLALIFFGLTFFAGLLSAGASDYADARGVDDPTWASRMVWVVCFGIACILCSAASRWLEARRCKP